MVFCSAKSQLKFARLPLSWGFFRLKLVMYGIGTDVIQISRIAKLHAKNGDRFLQKFLHPTEIAAFHARKGSSATTFLAGRFG